MLSLNFLCEATDLKRNFADSSDAWQIEAGILPNRRDTVFEKLSLVYIIIIISWVPQCTTAAHSCACCAVWYALMSWKNTQLHHAGWYANDVSTGLRPATGYDAARLHGMPWPWHEYKVSRYHHQPSTEMPRQPRMQEDVKPELSMKGSTQINGIKKHQSSRRLIAKVFAIMQHALKFYSTALQVCSCLLQQTKKYEKTTQELSWR